MRWRKWRCSCPRRRLQGRVEDADAETELDVRLDDVGVDRFEHDVRLEMARGEGLVDPRPSAE